jgi:hypothetical protein
MARRKGQFRRITLGLFVSYLSGCSYASLISVQAEMSNSPPLSDNEISRATEVVAHVAAEFTLVPRMDADYLGALTRQPASGMRELARYSQEPPRDADARNVLLWVGVDRERGTFQVLIRDWRSLRENAFTRSLGGTLATSLRKAFPSHSIEVERLNDMPIFYVP